MSSVVKYLLTGLICCLFFQGSAQNFNNDPIGRNDRRIITTAVPFLTISPDARSGAMGDVGAALEPTPNANYWNPSKLAFMEKHSGFAVSYTPWLRKLINDMSLSYLSGYMRTSDIETFGVSLRYFDLGSIQFTDEQGNKIRDFNPREYSIDASYARKLTQQLSVGVSLRFIHSNISGNVGFNDGTETKPGNTAGGDVSVYYRNQYNLDGKKLHLGLGGHISNLGAKISYTNADQEQFIPTNLRLGSSAKMELDPYNTFTFALDFNKLMVPSPPVRDSTGIVRGKDPNRPLLSGIFGSFSDAPNGLSEELKEFKIATGVEYWYQDLFAARAGYFFEPNMKGGRKYFTLGFGLRYQVFGVDFSYLIPQQQNHPLAETLRFSLTFNFEESEDGKNTDKN